MMKTDKQQLMEDLILQLEKLKKQTNKCIKQVRQIGLELEVEGNVYARIEAEKHIEQINNRMNLND